MPTLSSPAVHRPGAFRTNAARLALIMLMSTALQACSDSNAAPPAANDSPSPIPGETKPAATISTTLRIHGLVRQPQMLTVETLQQFKPVSIEQIPITSASGSPRGELKQLVGVPLRDLLDKAEIQLDSRHDSKKIAIIASGTDDYRVIFSWSEIYNTRVGEGVIVFYQQEGRPLPDRSGRIALISRDDLRTGPRHVKWLNDIEVRKIVD